MYKQAIDVIKQLFKQEGEQAIDLLLEITKIHPGVVVKAAAAIGLQSKEIELRKMVMSAPHKLFAIKEWRLFTGASLKDAKEAVEAIRNDW